MGRAALKPEFVAQAVFPVNTHRWDRSFCIPVPPVPSYLGCLVVTPHKRGWESTATLANVSSIATMHRLFLLLEVGSAELGLKWSRRWDVWAAWGTLGVLLSLHMPARRSWWGMERQENAALGGSGCDGWGSAVAACNTLLFIHLTPYALGKIAVI